MSPVIDVRTELRKIAASKPVHAAAGAGVVASEALRELPARLAKLRTERAALEQRATGYVTEVRTRAVSGYDKLALRGRRVLNGKPAAKGKTALNGKNK
jgi:hypothetical protein